jgi:two-component system LytT family sensor kinase
MNPWKPNRIEWINYMLLMPVVACIVNYILYEDRFFNDYRIWVFSFPLMFIIGILSWYLHVVSMHFLRMRLPELRQTGQRLMLLFITHMTLIIFTMWIFFYGFGMVDFLGYEPDLHKFKISMLLGLFITVVGTTLMEGDYIFRMWKETLAEKEKFEQLNLQQEFDHLKSQVNPHFLFNSFNTLSSLISEDSEQAECFLDELSKVYRYLLRNNEDGLTTLQNELEFIRSYFRLLTYRYGNAIQMKIETDKKYENYLLPSLSLQLLVENAVKHNIISRQMPLVIDIFTTAGSKLVMNNNFQPKVIKAVSNKIGLENIRTKYELLEQKGFQVLKDDKNFTVVLPLMWTNTKDSRLLKTKKLPITH